MVLERLLIDVIMIHLPIILYNCIFLFFLFNTAHHCHHYFCYNCIVLGCFSEIVKRLLLFVIYRLSSLDRLGPYLGS